MLIEFGQFGYPTTVFRIDDISGFKVVDAVTEITPAREAGWLAKARPEQTKVVFPAKVILFFRGRGDKHGTYELRCAPYEDANQATAEVQNAEARAIGEYVAARMRGLEPTAIVPAGETPHA